MRTRHTLKFGPVTRRSQYNDELQKYHRGFWQFNSAAPYNALENFAHGIVQTYQQGFGPEINGYRTTEVNLYVQEDWRASRALDLNIGAQVEHAGIPSEGNQQLDIG